MPTIRRFEDLEIWQAARAQCIAVNKLIESTPLKNDFSLRDQVTRSSGSVMDNIAEGFDRFTRKDFRHMLTIARGSNAEVRSQLYRMLDKGYLEQDIADQVIKSNIRLSVKITNLISHLSKTSITSKSIMDKKETLEEPASIYGL
ncbi:MAG: four helix bundle protein [Sphingobacteriales bacterium]|nr:MAG: four helix bundle protein [Sphingobacteriales bacterium]